MITVGSVISDLLSLKQQEITLRKEFVEKLNTLLEVRGERLQDLHRVCDVKPGVPLQFWFNGTLYNEQYFSPNIPHLFGTHDGAFKVLESDIPIPDGNRTLADLEKV